MQIKKICLNIGFALLVSSTANAAENSLFQNIDDQRNERNANAAIVIGITPEDFPSAHPLAGVELQRKLESKAFI